MIASLKLQWMSPSVLPHTLTLIKILRDRSFLLKLVPRHRPQSYLSTELLRIGLLFFFFFFNKDIFPTYLETWINLLSIQWPQLQKLQATHTAMTTLQHFFSTCSVCGHHTHEWAEPKDDNILFCPPLFSTSFKFLCKLQEFLLESTAYTVRGITGIFEG